MSEDNIHLIGFSTNSKASHTDTQFNNPRDKSINYTSAKYWKELARTCEEGKFDAFFFADTLAPYETYTQSIDPTKKYGTQYPVNDPLLALPAMAEATEHLGLASTVSVTYEDPYLTARKLATLDHLTDGRVGWNIVTSFHSQEAKNIGTSFSPKEEDTVEVEGTTVIKHDSRYAISEEYMDVVYKLWEHSWDDDANVAENPDYPPEQYAIPEKIHDINHEGEYFTVPGVSETEPSPQRTPVLYQAGQSDRGREFAAKHAEAAFTVQLTPSGLKEYADDVKNRTEKYGRNSEDIKIILGVVPFISPTEQEAQAKYEKAKEYVNYEGALVKMAGHTGIDYSQFDPDDSLTEIEKQVESEAILGLIQQFTTMSDRDWTLREAGIRYGIGFGHPTPTGTPEQVADELEEYIENGADGFMITQATSPGTIRDTVELLVPELQKRGLFREEYEGESHREILTGEGPGLPSNHPAKDEELRNSVRNN